MATEKKRLERVGQMDSTALVDRQIPRKTNLATLSLRLPKGVAYLLLFDAPMQR